MITTPDINDSTFHELQNEIQNLKSEKEDFKQTLLKLWIQISKTFNDDFEEILKLGINSDVEDIMNAILIVEEARQEQINNERNQMVALTEQLNSHKNTTDSGNEELKELEKQYRELSELVLSLKQQNVDKDLQIATLNAETNKLKGEVALLSSKLNELSGALIYAKEEKIKYMEQTQNQIKLLMEKDLQHSRQVQMLQIQKIELENSLRKNNQRNEQSINMYCQTQREEEQARMLSCSPRTTHIDFSKIVQLSLQNKKAEMVSGSSLSQIPYRFGK
ncbi:unnamed protein product (macronuclear) [Paramecium tetraurelia]|uniref:Uncharacterized protein n=1 Tax=Paramecium tetraurelia TaxID=5888 RepID=A0E364_PARTE|nr:uncharacterized protein GSPATT00022904001 [Paramecium tetraurelia]CAK89731.1 unnamed protein product [Paramecium tetraurelia]|eukprot:XP_001457128.1 hypothetical protein (macronuclear) [Paramecium tetraurelia strain d4-2]